MTRVASRQEDRYRHARLHLHAEARPSRRVVGRRFVPPGIPTSGPQPPAQPSAKSAWCQSRDRAAPTRHAPRQEVRAWGGSGSAWPVPGQPDASQVAIAMLHASWRRTGLALDGRRARCGQADGSALDEDRVSVVIPGSFARCSRPSRDRVWSCARRRSMFFATLRPALRRAFGH